jgi:hypothetical protein
MHKMNQMQMVGHSVLQTLTASLLTVKTIWSITRLMFLTIGMGMQPSLTEEEIRRIATRE